MNNYMFSATVENTDDDPKIRKLFTIYGATSKMNKGQVHTLLSDYLRTRPDIKGWKCIVLVVGTIKYAL